LVNTNCKKKKRGEKTGKRMNFRRKTMKKTREGCASVIIVAFYSRFTKPREDFKPFSSFL